MIDIIQQHFGSTLQNLHQTFGVIQRVWVDDLQIESADQQWMASITVESNRKGYTGSMHIIVCARVPMDNEDVWVTWSRRFDLSFGDGTLTIKEHA